MDGVITEFIVDKNRDYAQVLEERDNLGSLTANYLYGGDLILQDRGGVESYYHYDGLGSTRALSDVNGATTDAYTYEAFGNTIQHSGTTENIFKFTGELQGPNGFYYLRARYYNPDVGRFVTADPFEGRPNEPATLHKYSYANMNPVMYVDPSGKFSIVEMVSATAIFSVLISLQGDSSTVAVYDYLEFDGDKLTWYSRTSRGKEKKKEWGANSGMIKHDIVLFYPIPKGLYFTSPSDKEYHFGKEEIWGPFSYRLHETAITYMKNRLIDREGFHIHGGRHYGTEGCIEFTDVSLAQTSLNEFDKMIKDYGRRIDLYAYKTH